MNAKGKRFDRFPFFVLAGDCEDGTENSLFRKKNKVFSFAAGRCNILEICIVAKGVQMRKIGIRTGTVFAPNGKDGRIAKSHVVFS